MEVPRREPGNQTSTSNNATQEVEAGVSIFTDVLRYTRARSNVDLGETSIPLPDGSDVTTELKKCVAFCQEALAAGFYVVSASTTILDSFMQAGVSP